MSGQELPRLSDPARFQVRELGSSELSPPSLCVALAQITMEPRETSKISTSQPAHDKMRGKFGTSWIKRYNSVRVNRGDKSGYGTKKLEGGVRLEQRRK